MIYNRLNNLYIQRLGTTEHTILFGTGSHEHFKQFNAKTEMQWQMSEIH